MALGMDVGLSTDGALSAASAAWYAAEYTGLLLISVAWHCCGLYGDGGAGGDGGIALEAGEAGGSTLLLFLIGSTVDGRESANVRPNWGLSL
eukprot:1293128-Pyramimonas_sp.AAC.1